MIRTRLYNALSRASIRKEFGIRYLGNTKQSAKMMASYKNGTETYCIYLAPADMSGYNVCPNNIHCKAFCLNGSGHNKVEQLSGKNHIQTSRIKKTKMFFENKDKFMQLLIQEIETKKAAAEKKGMGFSVRLNGTSDLSPEDFVYEGRNILEWFPEVQFYDYTKVAPRFNILHKYANYDITYSFNGYNWFMCEKFLRSGGKVAVVFDSETMPKTYKGFKVVSGNEYDMRYLDPKGVIIGLHYHRTANDYKNGVYNRAKSKFVVDMDDINCEW